MDNWDTSTSLHLAAYVMWRLNWIHPFADGNGRTARAVSYITLCMKMGGRIPDTSTIPDLISENKRPYYDALEAADESWASRQEIDLTELEETLGNFAGRALVSALEEASGRPIA
jgi:Fic family protein